MERQGETVAGPVSQIRMGTASTVLRASSSHGAYFLKAPTVGSAELDVTQAVHEVLPERTLELIEISRSLGSFVSRGFETVYSRGEVSEEAMSRTIVMALGEMQLASIEHTGSLV